MDKQNDRGARAMRCEECGKGFEIDGLRETVFCGHCGHRQSISPELLGEMRIFRQKVDEHTGVAQADLNDAAYWDRSAAQVQQGTRPGEILLVIGLAVVFPIAVILAGVALLNAGVIPKGNDSAIGFLAMGATVVGLTAYFVIYYSRRSKRQYAAQTLSTAVRCPECGAANLFSGSNDTTACTYCGAALIPEKATRAAVIDAAQQQRRQAHMEKLRAERAGYGVYSKVGLGPLGLVWMIGGSFLLMLGGSSIAFSVQMMSGEEPYHPVIFLFWFLTLAIIGGLVFTTLHIKGKSRRVTEAMGELASQLQGIPLTGIGDTVDWLNTYWTDTVNPLKLFPGRCYGVAEMTVAGFPVLVDVNAVAATPQHETYACIRTACHIPSESVTADSTLRSEQAEVIRKRLTAAGFVVAISSAGILVEAGEIQLSDLKNAGNILSLADPIAETARLAAALDALPGAPIP